MSKSTALRRDSDPEYLKKDRADLAARNTKTLLRISYNLLRMLSLLAEDLTDIVTQDIFSISNAPGWNVFANMVLPFLSALIWVIQVAQDSIALTYTVTSKWKRILLLSLSIIGTITGIIVVVASFIAFNVGAVAALPLFIALGAALLAIRMAFMLHLSHKKTAKSWLIDDRENSITKLLKHSKLENYFQEGTVPTISTIQSKLFYAKKQFVSNVPVLEKLLRLSLQTQAVSAEQQGTACLWQKLLAEDILHYEKEKTTERKLELALVSTVAAGSFLLLAPTPITATMGGALIILAALLSVSWAAIRFCGNSFENWNFNRRIAEFSQSKSTLINNSPESINNDFLKTSYLQRKGLIKQEEQENYWTGLPEELQHKKRLEELSFLEPNRKPENRGKLIAQWYTDQLVSLPEKPKEMDSFIKKSWHIFKEAVGFLIKKIIFTVLLAPILLVATAYYAYDKVKTSECQVACKRLSLPSKTLLFSPAPSNKEKVQNGENESQPLLPSIKN